MAGATIHVIRRLIVLLISLLIATSGLAQPSCSGGIRVDGSVVDSTRAVIAGAQVMAADGQKNTTDAAGHFMFHCIPTDSAMITVQAEGFAPGTATVGRQPGEIAHINLNWLLRMWRPMCWSA
jgi:hypothetical protein